MATTLTITLPEHVLERLRRRAAAEGKTPEILAAEDLAKFPAPTENDPLLECMGMFASTVPDAAERHDHYLGQALQEELAGRAEPK